MTKNKTKEFFAKQKAVIEKPGVQCHRCRKVVPMMKSNRQVDGSVVCDGCVENNRR